MAEEENAPATDTTEEDFGGFLGRRLRSYQSGVLGVSGLSRVPVGAADQGASVINRSADFSNSLQSLLSYRAAGAIAAPPPAGTS